MVDVDSYIEAYRSVRRCKNKSSKVKLHTNILSSTNYDGSTAAAYATSYWSNYNSNYPDWSPYGGDCANFVSQCLYAGGKRMSFGPSSDTSYWFSSGSIADINQVSSTWRGADAFKEYWTDHSQSQSFNSYEGAYSFGYKGDAVAWLNSRGRAFHIVVIVGYNTSAKDLVYAAHTQDTITGSIKYIAGLYPFIIFHM